MEKGLLNGLDLFSGYGGITLALSEWVRPIAYCEIERYAQSIILSRSSEGKLPASPIWDDVKTLNGEQFKGKVDIIYGGFPCQDISIAGLGKGLEGERSGLFFEVCRLVKEVNPSFVFLENVPAIRTKGLLRVIDEFTNMGYGCRWTCISAKEVGASHLRKRWFLLAHTKHTGLDGSETLESSKQIIQRCSQRSKVTLQSSRGDTHGMLPSNKTLRSQSPWEVESPVGRVFDGCPSRVDRIKSLGNGVVPIQVKEAFKRLMGLEVTV